MKYLNAIVAIGIILYPLYANSIEEECYTDVPYNGCGPMIIAPSCEIDQIESENAYKEVANIAESPESWCWILHCLGTMNNENINDDKNISQQRYNSSNMIKYLNNNNNKYTNALMVTFLESGYPLDHAIVETLFTVKRSDYYEMYEKYLYAPSFSKGGGPTNEMLKLMIIAHFSKDKPYKVAETLYYYSSSSQSNFRMTGGDQAKYFMENCTINSEECLVVTLHAASFITTTEEGNLLLKELSKYPNCLVKKHIDMFLEKRQYVGYATPYLIIELKRRNLLTKEIKESAKDKYGKLDGSKHHYQENIIKQYNQTISER